MGTIEQRLRAADLIPTSVRWEDVTAREAGPALPSPRRALAVVIAIVVAAAGIGLAAWAFSSRRGLQPSGTATPGPIVFVQMSPGGALDGPSGDLYRVNPDGLGLQRLTRLGDVTVQVAVSPDGSQVAFATASGPSGPWDIYVVDLDGSGLHRLTHAGYVQVPILASPPSPGQPAGRSTSPRPVIDEWPSWTPEGKIRYFQNTASGHHPGPGQGLWEVNPDGTGAHLVVPGWVPFEPGWSPDGSHVAWQGDIGTGRAGTDVFVANADGSGRHRLTADLGQADFPAWSPDGSRIAFADSYDLLHRPPGKGTIQVMNPDGSARRTLFSCVGCTALWPAWSPDGRSIVFTLIEDTAHLEVVNADGTGLHPLPGLTRRRMLRLVGNSHGTTIDVHEHDV